jgi:phage tail-like protein
MANEDPDYTNTPVSHWTITGDVEITYLQSLSGIGDSSPVEGTAYQAKTGEPMRPRWWSKATVYNDITLQRVLDTDDTLRQWRQGVKDGKKSAKKSMTIIAQDAEGNDVHTWSVVGAWPSSYQVAGMESGSDAQSYETITITHDGCSPA